MKEKKIILSLIAICLMIGAPTAMASKGLWVADDSVVPPDMVVYHLFIDGVNPVWGQACHF